MQTPEHDTPRAAARTQAGAPRRQMKSRILKSTAVSLFACAAVVALAANAQAASSGGGHGSTAKVSEEHGSTGKLSERLAAKTAAKSGGHGGAAAKAEQSGGGHWDYGDQVGPDNWGQISPDYLLCEAGTMQSPIDIADGFGATGEPIELDYRLTPLSIVHNGHTVQVDYAHGSGITVAGKRYELLQFHFHSPNERAVGHSQAAMEMHLVHKAADGQLAVVGIMMEGGSENLALREVWNDMPEAAGPVQVADDVLINARDLLPADTGYYRYMGSLTTPPCSEGVNWFVLTQPIQVGMAQVARFVDAVGFNARPVQSVNHRLVLAPGGSQSNGH